MAPAVLCLLFLLATVAPPDVTTLTSLPTSSRRTVNDPGRQVQGGNCGQGLCNCWGDRAVCYGDSTTRVIPTLPTSIADLAVGLFDLRVLSPETAKNLMILPLQNLTLEACNISSVDPTVLAAFNNLSSLSLSDNLIPEEALYTALKGLSNRQLRYLDLGSMNLESLFPLTSLQSTAVVELDLSMNSFPTLNMSALQNLRGLSALNLAVTKAQNVHLTSLPDLTWLNLDGNEIEYSPDFCPKGTAVFPKLEHLVLSNNYISFINSRDIHCLTSLRTLDLSYNRIDSFHTNTFFSLRSLEMVSMQNMRTDSLHMDDYALNNSNLFHLDISNAHLVMRTTDSGDFFAGCSNLSFLNISGNDLSPESDDMLFSLFSHLPALEHLSAARCWLKQIPEFLVTLHNLIYIDLSSNQLTTTTQPLPMEVQDRLKYVNLRDNPFQCSCSWLWLKEWIQRNTTEFLGYPHNIVCANPPYDGVLFEDFPMSEESCLLAPTTRYLVVALSSVLLLLVSILPVIYRYRWNIQYLVFMLRYDRHRHQAQQEARHFRYDAFVIYDSMNHAWVVTHLMAALEDTQGLRLCLHERDFLAGRLIVDNIVDNISASRKVLAILSEGSAASEWCQFELSLTHRLTLERGHDLLVVVMLEEVARAHVTRTMWAVLKTTTYIAWPDEERAREAFWNRLGEAVRD